MNFEDMEETSPVSLTQENVPISRKYHCVIFVCLFCLKNGVQLK